MIKQKNISLFFTLIFILPQITSGKSNFNRKSNFQSNFKIENGILERKSNFINNYNSTNITQTDYFIDTFDSSLDGWTINEGWNRTDLDSHSPDHSMNSFENNQINSQVWQITSRTYTLPLPPLDENIHYSFWLRNDMRFGGIDDDGNIDQFFSLSLLVPSNHIWHPTTLNSYDGRSYWCGDEELNGYGDSWVQYLDTPEILIQPNSELSAMMKWAIEDTELVEEAGIEAICENGNHTIDGWDQANVQISTDGGSTWDILIGNNNPYDFQCGYGSVYNGFTGLPGWSGIQGWHEITFDLSSYASQNIIIRFAFYSDPSWSTIDDLVLTGLQIDDIRITGLDDHDVLFSDNVDVPEMIGSGENWEEQLYDYWDNGSESEFSQPGSIIWEEYKPGTAFDSAGNILQSLTKYAGQDIKFRFQTFFDGDSEGGIGTGLFIDDFRIYSELTESYPPPSNLIVEDNDTNIKLTWSNLLNYEGDYVHILDSGNNAIFDETTIDCGSSDGCITYMGNLFYIHGNSSVDSVFIYNKNEFAVEVNLAAFSMVGTLFNPEPSFVENVTLSESNTWNSFSVEGWDFSNPYIIAHTITGDISISQDTNTPASGAFFDGSIWTFINPQTNQPYLTAGIRAKVTKENSDVTYNVYRMNESNNDFIQLANLVTDTTYIDDTVIELEEYTYGISATYPDDNESEKLIHAESISIMPASYQELSWDDGLFESSLDLDSEDSLAVKFRASTTGQQIMRLKWFQIDDGGAVKVIVWEDPGNGIPSNILYSKLLTTNYTPTAGWNEYDISEQDWTISGDFWMGLRFYEQTSPIGIDYDEGSNSSMYRDSDLEWSIIDDWNFGIRVFLDCASENIDECGVCDGDNSNCLDCAGVPNGNSIEDCADVCGGSAELDCTGVCGGDSGVEDNCGVCDNDTTNDNETCTGCMNQNYEEYDEDATIPCEDCCSSIVLANNEDIIPYKFEIINVYPNPFNPQINIEYNLPTTSNVRVSIYNLNGEEVEQLVDSIQYAGFHSLTWVATGQNSGIYFLQIASDSNVINRKLMYLK